MLIIASIVLFALLLALQTRAVRSRRMLHATCTTVIVALALAIGFFHPVALLAVGVGYPWPYASIVPAMGPPAGNYFPNAYSTAYGKTSKVIGGKTVTAVVAVNGMRRIIAAFHN